ncbi:MAG: sugar transferase [Lachnospiraceae bacterium]|nr:sugar transferase [Lachnospiraceae bacterium]
MYKNGIKRGLDIVLSGLALILLSPLLLVVAALVRIKLGSPVIFHQERPGKNGKIFTLCKFRTMTDDKNKEGNLLPDNERLTGFGKLLRATSLDELPELWNIFKGDMSIIGPRPLLVSYLPYYTQEEQRRHSVRPGLTGLAQINGRSVLSWEERFAYDLEYVDKCSFSLDLKIFFQTIGKVFTRSGTLEGEAQSLPDFDEYRRNQSII